MIKPHAPFQDGSKHAANNYCPTCHGDYYQWQNNIQQNINAGAIQQMASQGYGSSSETKNTEDTSSTVYRCGYCTYSNPRNKHEAQWCMERTALEEMVRNGCTCEKTVKSSLPTEKPLEPSITVEKKLTKKEWEAEQKVQTIKAELDAMISEPLRTPSFWELLGGMGAFYTESFMCDIRISNKQHEYIEALKEQSSQSLKQGEE